MKDNRIPISFKLNEWTGALGDIGVLIPIFISLLALNGLPAGRPLFLIGILYIFSAIFFRLPIPVQPLKAMAAIVIAQSLPVSYLSAGGVWMGIILILLSVTGKIEWLSQYFTKPIVKGIQLGVGLMLIKTGFLLFISPSNYGYIAVKQAADLSSIGYWGFISALWVLVLPQLPLTLGNAVFAVSDTAREYFGEKSEKATPKNFAVSLGIANIIAGLSGGMPMCHGSGGLTAHYRFGARSAGATIIMGGISVIIAFLFPHTLLNILQSIPHWILGVMLLYVGICHAMLIKGLSQRRVEALVMGGIGLLTNNLFYSLLFGLFFERVVLSGFIWTGLKNSFLKPQRNIY